MKWLIASDIHGSAYYCEKLVSAYKNEKADRMILLGDILYHGPRNDLPRDYNPKRVIEILNGIKESVLCVRGNCDTEVDQMVLSFPILADYAVIDFDDKIIYVTHGHKYNENCLPPVKFGDIILHGHTHIPRCEEINGVMFLNPGSVSIPKEHSECSYMIYENGNFSWKNLDGNKYKDFHFE